MIRRLLQSSFASGVAVLTGGTAIAQALGVLVLPVLTRLYTPNDFGILGIFSGLLSILTVVAALRFQIAIPIPDTDAEAGRLLIISLLCVLGTSLLTATVVTIASPSIASESGVKSYLWLLPIAVLLTGSYTVFQSWALRKKAFTHIARTRIEQAIGGIGSQLGLGWFGLGAFGLVVGQIVSNGSGFIGLAMRAWHKDKDALRGMEATSIYRTAYEYRRYPTYSTFEALANAASLQLPLLLIATMANQTELGFVILVMRILQSPMSLIGTSVAQVYYSQAISEFKNGNLNAFTIKTAKRLALLGTPPIALVAVLAPVVFSTMFGASWARAGELVVWMAPFFLLQFIASPISMSLHVINRQGWALTVQLLGLIVRLLSIWAIKDFPTEAFAVGSALFYFLYLLIILKLTRRAAIQKTIQ